MCYHFKSATCSFLQRPRNRGLALSIIETSDWWEVLRMNRNDDWRDGMAIVSVVFAVFVVVFVVWHFAEAWRVLPGAYYLSGQVPVSYVLL